MDPATDHKATLCVPFVGKALTNPKKIDLRKSIYLCLDSLIFWTFFYLGGGILKTYAYSIRYF